MSTCASCRAYRCRDGDNYPNYCPSLQEAELLKSAAGRYSGEDLRTARVAALVEAAGYGHWPRAREIMEFAARMGYNKIGLAFCLGLREEARIFSEVLQHNGFTVNSAICKAGAVAKEEIGVRPEEKLCPGSFEPMCNPVAQANLLDAAGSRLNVILGLCVGHDTLFIKHSRAPVTVLAAKDRVLAHNPLGALYAGHYFRGKLDLAPEQEKSR